MRSLLLRVAALCLLILGLSHCGPDTVAMLVRVKNLPPGIVALQVNATLDGKPALQGAEFTDHFDQFAVTVPKDAISFGHLVIEVSAVDIDRCEISRALLDLTVHPDLRYSEADVSLVKLPGTLCSLRVDVTGTGTVTPSAGGFVHGTPDKQCIFPGACDFPKSQTVTLTSTRASDSWFVTDWGEPCAGQLYEVSGSRPCKVTLNRPTEMKVRLSDGFCSSDSWCWSNPVPQGNFIDGIWGSDASHVWAVGQGGTIV